MHVRPAHPENSSEPQPGRISAAISWGFLGENLSGPLFYRARELFQENRTVIPSKIQEKFGAKSAEKFAEKPAAKSAEKSAGKSATNSAMETCTFQHL